MGMSGVLPALAGAGKAESFCAAFEQVGCRWWLLEYTSVVVAVGNEPEGNMGFRGLALVGLALACLPNLAKADGFGDWSFSPPDGYEHAVTPNGMTYKGPMGGFIFLPAQDANGKTLAQLGPALVEEATGVPPAQQKFVRSFDTENGGQSAVYLAANDSAVHFIGVHLKDGRVGLALFATASSDVDAEMTALAGGRVRSGGGAGDKSRPCGGMARTFDGTGGHDPTGDKRCAVRCAGA